MWPVALTPMRMRKRRLRRLEVIGFMHWFSIRVYGMVFYSLGDFLMT